MIYWVFPNVKTENKAHRFDLWGFLLLGGAMALLLFTVDIIIDRQTSGLMKLAIFMVSVLMFVVYIRHALAKKEQAIVHLNIFKNRCFRYLLIISTSVRLGMTGTMFLFPLYLQMKQGFTALDSGLFLLFYIIPAIVVKRLARPMLGRLHYYRFFMLLLTIMLISCLLCAYVFSHFFWLYFAVVLAMMGFLFGCFTIVTNAGIYNAIEQDNHMGPATVLNSMTIQLSGAFGVAWVAVVLALVSGIGVIAPDASITVPAFGDVMLICAGFIVMTLLYVYMRKPQNISTLAIN